MSRRQRIARLLSATLPESVVSRLSEKYKTSVEQIHQIQDWVADLPQPDLVTEWLLSQSPTYPNRLRPGVALPEDLPRVKATLATYFQNRGNPAYQRAAYDGLPEDRRNIKNLLEGVWSLRNLEAINDRWTQTHYSDAEQKRLGEEKERINKLGELPYGAKLLYNRGGKQVVEVTEPEAACELGKGTKWCTSDLDTASGYLESGPLYVLYDKGRKTGQLHIDPNNQTQVMDLKDDVLDLGREWIEALFGAGLGRQLAEAGIGSAMNENVSEWMELHHDLYKPVIHNDPQLAVGYATNINQGRLRPAEAAILRDPKTAYLYARNVIGGRWPEGEKVIATSAVYSLYYARTVLKGRFPEGEPAILKSPYDAVAYASQILKKPWPEAEPVIRRENDAWNNYSLIFPGAVSGNHSAQRKSFP